ncbi:MAG: class I mannose-6-phosphate isomerase [Prevotella sp.]|jgi:mannose-6-phosphate isomerase class I|nr:class I mannose-6-phosphate isomerase [Prevotella sp.]
MVNQNFDKCPAVVSSGAIWVGWEAVLKQISVDINSKKRFIISVECYQGVNHAELINIFHENLSSNLFIDTRTLFKDEAEIRTLTYPDVTDDAIFGRITRLTMNDFLSSVKLQAARKLIDKTEGVVIVYGHGASLVAPDADRLIYADMARWEIQLRMRANKADNLGLENAGEKTSEQYKRGFFVDWRVCDKLKKTICPKIDYWLDTNKENEPKMINKATFDNCMNAAVSQPFRVTPFFDPGPWGGQWMKEKFGLDKGTANFAWSFDCVPEENSLLFCISDTIFEMPAINLVFFRTTSLLGQPVESRFGQEFPIRFDFLDTIGGGNLSLQVHPHTQYIRDKFGMIYTQDESYYMMEASEDAIVYLGLKKGVDGKAMIDDLNKAQEGGKMFDAEKYVNTFPAKKHDHFLIPAGTIHCSGKNSVVLEISATPYIFTFKLWDWGRMGLDGKPRPINIEHGSKVIRWEWDTDYAETELINKIEKIAQGDGWIEERTGLHRNEFIETRRHWFIGKVEHETGESVNVLNLVEGEEVVVESPDNKFAPFTVHYAETFIIPASVGRYTIRPRSENGKQYATIKAYVRFKS